MKAKIHIDINTYEFLEFELEGTDEEIIARAKELHQKFHRLCTTNPNDQVD